MQVDYFNFIISVSYCNRIGKGVKMVKSSKDYELYQLTNKRQALNDYIIGILNRTLSMFQYENLPDTLDRAILEKQLQINGYTVIFSYGGQLYSNVAGLMGQEKSPYNEPTQANINVPSLGISTVATLDQDCILIKNDDFMSGLIPTIQKHGTLMLENDITLLVNDYNSRMQTIFSGGTDQTINSAGNYLSKVIDGDMGIVADNSFLKDLSINSTATGQVSFNDLIAYQQYLKSDLYNELGLSSLNQMKQERMTTDEVNANNDNIYPFVDNMLANRKLGIMKLNKLFNGETVTVDFTGTWKDSADQRTTPEPAPAPKETTKPIDQPKQATPEPEPEPEQKPEPKPAAKTKEEPKK